MLETGLAQLRFAASILFGAPIASWSLDWLVAAALDTQREYGEIAAEVDGFVGGPSLDDATCQDVQLRRFRTQAARAARETRYYADLPARIGVDPGRLRLEDVPRVPITPKEALRADPDAFVRRSATPILRAYTSGTTGLPTSVAFSADELHTMVALSALAFLFSHQLSPADVVQISTSSRAVLGNLGFAGACARIGAVASVAGVIEPELTLALLRQERRLPGKKSRVSCVSLYPSSLGELVEWGLRRGDRPADFGVERIFTGGEIVTAGLKRRAARLFGDVAIHESYAMTETLPFGGTLCEQGHLHFEPVHGLLEVLDPETRRPVGPGEVGTLVATPFPPFRETTMLLRYDTQDVVRRLTGPFTCRLKNRPATTNVLGKLRLSVRHDAGWTCPREVLEALEATDEVPLPARCGFWAVPGGVAIEVVTPTGSAATRRAIGEALEARAIPVQSLIVVDDPRQLRHPLPLRCDLKENSFGTVALAPSPFLPRRETGESERGASSVFAPPVRRPLSGSRTE